MWRCSLFSFLHVTELFCRASSTRAPYELAHIDSFWWLVCSTFVCGSSTHTHMSAAQVALGARRELLYKEVWNAVCKAVQRLTFSVSPRDNIRKLSAYQMTRSDRFKYGFMLSVAVFSMIVMGTPSFPYKLIIPLLYMLVLSLPITSQLFLPAAPILLWLLLFYSCRFIDVSARPHIWVSVLPTLETIWYGANISDILTRFGHPFLDVLAWIPYGVVHFMAPFIVAAFIFVYAPEGSVKVFANSFGFMNLMGVIVQIAFPCAPPWYELREGLSPANYGMRGSPAGLARIDAIFGGFGYTIAFSSAPVVFGAFPSLHAATATCEALFLSYFFPVKFHLGPWRFDVRILYWSYCFWLYWSTMYLMHHYLIDLVAGGCLATFSFYFFRTEEVRDAMERREALMEQAEREESGEPEEEVFSLEEAPFRHSSNNATSTHAASSANQPAQARSHRNVISEMPQEPLERDPIFTLEEGDAESPNYEPSQKNGDLSSMSSTFQGQGLTRPAVASSYR